jgi:cobalamin biosynthesis protein CobD/CbiB
MGHVRNWFEARAPRTDPARLLYGLGVALAVPFGWRWLARAVEQRAPWPVQALLVKPTFAGRALLQAGRRVEVALEFSDLAQARTELRSLVSRPTSSLDGPLIDRVYGREPGGLMAGPATHLQLFRSGRRVRLPCDEYCRRDVGASHSAL